MINAISEMIFDIVITGIITLDFLILYMNVKINSVKTVGICKKNLACSRGNKGMFEYEIDGIKHYNAEKTMHLGTFKIEKNILFMSIRIITKNLFQKKCLLII